MTKRTFRYSSYMGEEIIIDENGKWVVESGSVAETKEQIAHLLELEKMSLDDIILIEDEPQTVEEFLAFEETN